MKHWLASLSAEQKVLRAGFGVVFAILVVSAYWSYRTQVNLADASLAVYQRHAKLENHLLELSRTIWLGTSAARDYLLNPAPDRLTLFRSEHARLRAESASLVEQVRHTGWVSDVTPFRSRLDEYWRVMEDVPRATAGLDALARFEFIRREVVSRRAALADVVHEFTEFSQSLSNRSLVELGETRKTAAARLALSLAAGLAAGLIVAWLSLSHSGRLEAQAQAQLVEVERAKANLEQLSARLMEIQEQERARLARELHDEIGQAVATLRLEISRADSLAVDRIPEIRERLNRARTLAEHTVKAVRNISLGLRPSILDDLGLGPALQWLAEDFTRRTGIHCQFDEQQLSATLTDAHRTCVFRVLQEALHNAEKHSGARRVDVFIEQESSKLVLSVSDDGRGFAPSSAQGRLKGGLGILGMKERASALHGTLLVDSSPGRGTRLRMYLPLPGAEPAVLIATESEVSL